MRWRFASPSRKAAMMVAQVDALAWSYAALCVDIGAYDVDHVAISRQAVVYCSD